LRIFALSDIHIDYAENRAWLSGLSAEDYRSDILILAGDVADLTDLLAEAFAGLSRKFRKVLFVPGNHDLWTYRNGMTSSLERFNHVRNVASDHGVLTGPYSEDGLSIIPLYGWYDYSFGRPSEELSYIWTDYVACSWPEGFNEAAITRHFTDMNRDHLSIRNERVITFSHFMPRIDLMPSIIPEKKRFLYPVLGTVILEEQIRAIGPQVHIYGHTHVNRRIERDGILYINNAFGYPRETRITRKRLVRVMEI
jgi:predicted phosphodiesterase